VPARHVPHIPGYKNRREATGCGGSGEANFVAIKDPTEPDLAEIEASAAMVVAEAAAAAGNEMSLSNMVLGFYEEAEREKWATEEAAGGGDGSDDEGAAGGGGGSAESSAFWQEQRSRLHVSHFPFSATRKQISVCLFRVWLLLLLNEPDSLRYTCFAYLTSCSC